jgi:hypothetical protein
MTSDGRTHDAGHVDLLRRDDADDRHLRSLDRKLQLVRDRVAGVVRGQFGLILHGVGGIGKTFTVQRELDRLQARYRLLNTHVTGLSLFNVLEQYPDHIHVLEDVEDILRERAALGVLRSATWPCRKDRGGNPERVVTWSSRGETREVVFRSGIILISNRPLASLPELEALATRITPVELVVTDPEIAAQMRRVAAIGYREGDQILGPEECSQVAEFVIAESTRLGQRLNMRLLTHGFADRLQADDHDAGLCWQDLVASRISQQPNIVGQIEPVGIRAQQKAEELSLVRTILALEPQVRLRAWQNGTGKSQSALYRRMAEVGAQDAVNFET